MCKIKKHLYFVLIMQMVSYIPYGKYFGQWPLVKKRLNFWLYRRYIGLHIWCIMGYVQIVCPCGNVSSFAHYCITGYRPTLQSKLCGTGGTCTCIPKGTGCTGETLFAPAHRALLVKLVINVFSVYWFAFWDVILVCW